jgi:hypothetical protein
MDRNQIAGVLLLLSLQSSARATVTTSINLSHDLTTL